MDKNAILYNFTICLVEENKQILRKILKKKNFVRF